MKNIAGSIMLRDKILYLEIQQAYEEQLLKDQFNYTYERLKPVNLLKSSFQDFILKPSIADHVLGTAMGLVTGYLSRKIVVGASGNLIRKLLGVMMQVGVANSVEQHSEALKSIGRYVYNYFLKNKENKL